MYLGGPASAEVQVVQQVPTAEVEEVTNQPADGSRLRL
jgi:hypothetical protein